MALRYRSVICLLVNAVHAYTNRPINLHHSIPVGVRSIEFNQSVCVCVCLSMSISLESLDRSSRNVCRSPVAVARSSSGGVAISPVLYLVWQCYKHIANTRYRTTLAKNGTIWFALVTIK